MTGLTWVAMVDPRIYRSGLALVAVAVIVFGFSLTSQPAPAGSDLAPVTLNGKALYASMRSMAGAFPHRTPGSAGDRGLAAYVAAQIGHSGGFRVTSSIAMGRTAAGERPVETVTAVRPGLTSGTIVLMADRDAESSPALADLRGHVGGQAAITG